MFPPTVLVLSLYTMEVPLLSQDEFFRHLNLQSVHAAAKFHYRHALKERLRASSIALRKERAEKLSPEKITSVVESASPCHLLSPTSSNRLFGRPVIRREVRALNFDDFSMSTNSDTITSEAAKKSEFLNGIKLLRKPSILKPLIADSRVFRHPGIKRELEERTRINGYLQHPSSYPTEALPPKKRAKIEVRCCYYKDTLATRSKVDESEKNKKEYKVSVRLQSSSSNETVEWERKMAAALTLFGHPRKSDVFSILPSLENVISVRNGGSHSTAASSHGKRSPSSSKTLLATSTKSAVTTLTKTPLATSSRTAEHDSLSKKDASSLPNGNNNNSDFDRCKEIRLCLTRLKNGPTESSVNPLSLSPTVKLEKLSLFHHSTKDSSCNGIDQIPRGSRPLLHRRAKDELSTEPVQPVTADQKVVKQVPEATSYICPICQKCFSSGQSLMSHGEQAHLKCQFCNLSVNSLWKRGMDDLDTCSACRSSRNVTVTPIVTKTHQQNALSTLEFIEHALKGDSSKKNGLEKTHKCDICSKLFDRRSRMIRHMTSCHAADIHKVDLSRFVYSKKLVQSELGVCS